jgi:hypothetical protein
MTISGQRLGKHIPMATNTHNDRVTVGNEVFLRGLCWDGINKGQRQLLVSSAWEAVKIEPERMKLKYLHY